MERKLQAICSGVEEVGSDIGEEIGADAGAPVIGTGVRGAALGSGLVGAAVVATGVEGANEELLAADCGRMTSTTNKAIAPARPNKILPKEIHRYTGRWYHFVLTSGTSNPSGTALWSSWSGEHSEESSFDAGGGDRDKVNGGEPEGAHDVAMLGKSDEHS